MKPSFGKVLIGVVVFGLCLGAAFGAGTIYGRHSNTPNAAAAANTTFNRGTNGNTDRTATSTATTAAATTSGTPQAGGSANNPAGFFGGFGARPLEGTVASVSDTALQVTLSAGGTSGNPTSVTIDDQTTYATAMTGDKNVLTSGAHVYVTTTAATDGTLDADSVIVLPANTQTTTQSTGGQSTTGASGTGRGTGGTGASGAQGTGGFGNGGGFGGGSANRPIDGTLASVNGQQIQITLANGSTSTVTLSDQTTYETTTTADKSAVTTGASVLITTSRGSDGGLSAASVVVLPASGATN